MSNSNKPGAQDAYYAPGSTIKDFFRSLFIGHGGSTQDTVHVRDAIEVKRTMTIVGMCLLPAILFAIYNIGLQAQLALAGGAKLPDTWHQAIFAALFGPLSAETGVAGLVVYGVIYYLPIYLAALVTTLFWEVVFAKVRKQQLHEGFFVTALLFSLCMPANIALWLVVMGISFGVVVAKELFGGMGYNFLNPALAGLAFIYFAYPTEVSTAHQLVAVDGYTSATTLEIAAKGGRLAQKLSFAGADYSWYQAFSDANWWNAFLGFEVGAVGETSALALLLGGCVLLITRLADWRIVAGVLLGMIVTATAFNLFGDAKNVYSSMPWTWHLVTGGFALGMMFMATDPVTTAYTRPGKLMFGLLVGFMAVVIRVANVKMPEGIMLAILFANLWAPLMDSLVARFNIKRRMKRNGIQ
ncbi:Na(+)-translocating NADH-quinone reductase subunit B [Shewanella mangrovi]|uniref:Na(+)-translocating NADH-quinone reductase subunit B n=1 Tax=Shewanella mangrovi TaxID=1515746 RepID=A0A094JDZ2_9GAMM|nr:NADH:ubiquinone reductase (Na(+)-transporting) subunit B [Shewanella mangrovi]KFZ37432.1 Na(+)-translocating NADH-quinone reductase subunit B [Shewanella mangrovi]